MAERMRALEESDYGKCVWRCDNNQPGQQDVEIYFEGGIKANFQLRQGGDMPTREIRIGLERGKILGDFDSGILDKITYGAGKGGSRTERIDLACKDERGHGGGDPLLLQGFYDAITTGDPSRNLTNPEESLESHLIGFAANESAINGGARILFQEYKADVESR